MTTEELAKHANERLLCFYWCVINHDAILKEINVRVRNCVHQYSITMTM